MCSAKTFSPPLLMGLKETQRGRGGQGAPQENMSRLFVPRASRRRLFRKIIRFRLEHVMSFSIFGESFSPSRCNFLQHSKTEAWVHPCFVTYIRKSPFSGFLCLVSVEVSCRGKKNK